MKGRKTNKLNQKGFGAIEVLLVFAIVGLIGGVGYYVYSQNEDKKSTNNTQSQVAQNSDEKPKAEEKIPEGWKQYKGEEAGIQFIYPEDWTEAAIDEEFEKWTKLKLATPETAKAFKELVESGVSKDMFNYDLSLSYWPSERAFLDRIENGYALEKYNDLANFLEDKNTPYKLIGKKDIKNNPNGTAYEVIVGGIGENYTLIVQTDKGIFEFSFITLWNKDDIDSETKKLIDSIEAI